MTASTSAAGITSHGLAGSVAVLIVGVHESTDAEGFVVLVLAPAGDESLAAREPPPHATAIDVNAASMAQRSHRVLVWIRMAPIVWTTRVGF
jgi:hypothetical protein